MDSRHIVELYCTAVENGKLQCNYCKATYAKNVTRIARHFASKCIPAPLTVKQAAAGVVTKIDKKNKNTSNKENISNNSSSCLSSQNTSVNEEINELEKINLWKQYARTTFSLGVSPSCVNNPHWVSLFSSWNPVCPLPTEELLRTELLEEEYRRAQSAMKSNVTSALAYGLIIDDRLTTEISIYIAVPEVLLYQVVEKEFGMEELTLIERIKKIITDLRPQKCIGILGSLNFVGSLHCESLINFLSEDEPKSFIHACANDLFKSILENIYNSPKNLLLRKKLDEIFSIISNNEELLEEFNAMQTKLMGRSITFINSETLIFGKEQVVKDIKKAMHCLRFNENVSDNLRSLMLSNTLWSEINSLHAFLEPIRVAFMLTKETNVHLSDMKHFHNNIRLHLQSKNDFILSDAHLEELLILMGSSVNILCSAANILDPRYLGADNNEMEQAESVDYLLKIGVKLNLGQRSDILNTLSNLKLKEGPFNLPILWNPDVVCDPRAWWSTMCANNLLTPLACLILSLEVKLKPSENENKSMENHNGREKLKFLLLNANVK